MPRIALATPAGSHYRLAREALEHGKHILVEKPLTLNSGEARKLIDLAEAQGRVLMVGHVFEYNPAVRAMRELIQSGHIGWPYYVHSTRVNIECIQEGKRPLTDGESGLRVVKVLEAAQESLKNQGKPVEIDL